MKVVEAEAEEKEAEEEETNWVQCDRCDKWRVLKGRAAAHHMHHHMGPWFCEMNISDRARAACDAPEQAWDDDEGEEEGEEEGEAEEEEQEGEEATGPEGVPCPDIGPGWRRVSKTRPRRNKMAGAVDHTFFAPDGRRFTSRAKAVRYAGGGSGSVDSGDDEGGNTPPPEPTHCERDPLCVLGYRHGRKGGPCSLTVEPTKAGDWRQRVPRFRADASVHLLRDSEGWRGGGAAAGAGGAGGAEEGATSTERGPHMHVRLREHGARAQVNYTDFASSQDLTLRHGKIALKSGGGGGGGQAERRGYAAARRPNGERYTSAGGAFRYSVTDLPPGVRLSHTSRGDKQYSTPNGVRFRSLAEVRLYLLWRHLCTLPATPSQAAVTPCTQPSFQRHSPRHLGRVAWAWITYGCRCGAISRPRRTQSSRRAGPCSPLLRASPHSSGEPPQHHGEGGRRLRRPGYPDPNPDHNSNPSRNPDPDPHPNPNPNPNPNPDSDPDADPDPIISALTLISDPDPNPHSQAVVVRSRELTARPRGQGLHNRLVARGRQVPGAAPHFGCIHPAMHMHMHMHMHTIRPSTRATHAWLRTRAHVSMSLG